MEKKINIHQEAVEGAKNQGHTLRTAIIELVDNSFDAGSEKVDIDIYQNHECKLSKIVIKDYGRGMDSEGVERFFDIGSTNSKGKKDATGNFGFGAHYALAFLGTKIKLDTKTDKSKKKLVAEWIPNTDYQNYRISEKTLIGDQSFTEISIDVDDKSNSIDNDECNFDKNRTNPETRFGRLITMIETHYNDAIKKGKSIEVALHFEKEGVWQTVKREKLKGIDPLYRTLEDGSENKDTEVLLEGEVTLNLKDEKGNPFQTAVRYVGVDVSKNGSNGNRSQFDRGKGAGMSMDNQGCYLKMCDRYLLLGELNWGGEKPNNNKNLGRLEFTFEKEAMQIFGIGANKSKPNFNVKDSDDENQKKIHDVIKDFRSKVDKRYSDIREAKSKKKKEKSENQPLISKLKEIKKDIDNLTPIQAQSKLAELIDLIA